MNETGIHHITSITSDVQANVDFYAGFLGLRLVKQTAGYADAEQLHLIYGDSLGTPGSLLTFLVWEASGGGRTGIGQVSEVALAVSRASVGEWLTKALLAGIPVDGPSREFGEPVLRLKDPDGLIMKLFGIELPSEASFKGAPTRIRGVTLLSDKANETAKFTTLFGYRYGERAGPTQRMVSDTDVVDIRDVAGFVPSIPGAGIPDHVAFRAQDVNAVQTMRLSLRDHGPTEVHDRKYFLSLYARDPAGILMEYATDGPGLTVDETPDQLGQKMFLPPNDSHRADDLKALLPQFALPGQERFPKRALPFTHRFNRPDEPDGSTIVLLHGTGGNESDLMPIARRIAPQATLLGVRGRATEEGTNRWFRRMQSTAFDQADIRSEAEAFSAFVEGAISGYGLDANRLVFLGFSNGANFLAAAIQLCPDLVRHAILLRTTQVLENPPEIDLSATRLIILNGLHDPLAEKTSSLAEDLVKRGATVLLHEHPVDHQLSSVDVSEAARWLSLIRPTIALI